MTDDGQICDPQVNVLFYVNVNYFANSGGFSKVLERMPEIDDKALGLLKSMLKITLEVRSPAHLPRDCCR